MEIYMAKKGRQNTKSIASIVSTVARISALIGGYFMGYNVDTNLYGYRAEDINKPS